MASVSQYEVVENFWNGMSELVGFTRAINLWDFDEALGRQLSFRGVGAADAAAIHERADSGFVAEHLPGRRLGMVSQPSSTGRRRYTASC